MVVIITLITICTIIVGIIAFVSFSHINMKKQMQQQNLLIATSMRNALDEINKKNELRFDKLEAYISTLELTVRANEYEINTLKHTVAIQSHIINSISPKIKFKTTNSNQGVV